MQTQVFSPREVRLPPAGKVAIGLCLAGMAAILYQLYHTVPPEAWRLAWAATLEKHRSLSWWKVLELTLWLAVSLLAVGYQLLYRRRARLMLDDQQLRLVTGLPIVHRWLDWSLPLEDVRQRKVQLMVRGVPLGSNALALIHVGWGHSGLRRFAPAQWVPKRDLPDAGSVLATESEDAECRPPHRPMGLVMWSHPENEAWLQRRFNALPLVAALIAQGVSLPPLRAQSAQRAGTDLLRYRRLAFALKWLLPSVLVLGASLQHLARHQHYFRPWPWSVWLALGMGLVLGFTWWLWKDMPSKGLSRMDAGAIRTAQGVTATLLALLLAWACQAVPLVSGKWMGEPFAVDFVYDRARQRLVPEAGGATQENIPLMDTYGYWAAKDDGAIEALIVRDGWRGLWQQYDVEELNARIAEFLGSQKRANHPNTP